MAWNEADPAGNSAINLGDNSIRTLKTDVRVALAVEHEALTDIPSAPKARHKFSSDTSANRPAAVAALRRIYFNTTKRQMEIENYGQALPAASPEFTAYAAPIFATGNTVTMVFYMATPPTGWTAVAQNDKALRVVSSGGTGGTAGGTVVFSTAFSANSGSTDLAHTHALSSVGTFTAAAGGATVLTAATPLSTDGASVSMAHTHTDPANGLAYADVVIASFD